MSKIYVSVMALHPADGAVFSCLPVCRELAAGCRIIPYRIFTHDNKKIYIDRITDIRPCASTKAGGLGDRYTCTVTCEDVRRHGVFLFLEDDGTWFMEEKL